eukprot:6929388-Prymnesium_polylepis.1
MLGVVKEARDTLTRTKQGPDIVKMVTRALVRIGKDDEDAAHDIARKIEDILHVSNALSLCNILIDDGRSADDLRAILKGPLFDSLQAEAGAVLPALMANAPPVAAQRTVTMEICRVDITDISDIDQRDLSFFAKLFTQCRVVDGSLDTDLRSASRTFPLDQYRRPTFRPSAMWFLDQCDFATSRGTVTTKMSSVTKSGDDLMINKRIEGKFFAGFDGLRFFPFE